MGKPSTLPHGGQILTTKRGIQDFCRGNVEMIACNALVFCIAAGPDHPDYVDVLYAASSRLYMLDLMVYQSKDGIVGGPGGSSGERGAHGLPGEGERGFFPAGGAHHRPVVRDALQIRGDHLYL